MVGKGTLKWPDGRIYIGDWLNNQMHGVGEFLFSDGRIYTGAYVND